MIKRVSPVFWAVLVWWSSYALLFSAQIALMTGPQGMPMSWPQALGFSFGVWMTWVPLTLGLYWLVQRFPIARGQLLRAFAAMLAAALLVVLLRSVYVYLTDPFFHWYGPQATPDLFEVALTSFNNNFILAWIVIGAAHAAVFYRRGRDSARQVAVLKASLAEARLEAIRAKLNPHFLFNALNSVAEVVHEDAELADRMLVSLSALLREALAAEASQSRPLRDEIALVRHYVTIEQVRLQYRLRLQWQVDEDCLDVEVPTLILQPLVENAIVHGVARRRRSGPLRICARLHGRALRLEVENCAAADAPPVRGPGIGLNTVRSRLRLMHGEAATLEQAVTAEGRYLVRIELPVRSASRAPEFFADAVR